jgi:TetR/AcrR family transcriptional repressor of bet genes
MTDAAVPESAGPIRPPRKASRESRREQLIEATVEVLAESGFARTTLKEVAAKAGLSHGLVNFHFRSKDALLVETLLHLADEYRRNWQSALAAAPPGDPAARLDALLRADFRPEICTPSRLAAWCAYWGEAQSRPIYQERCGSNDTEYVRVIEEVCRDLIAAGGYDLPVERIARVLRVTIEGVWLDLVTMSRPYRREEALATVYTCAAAVFPRHFGPKGLLDHPAGRPSDSE